MGKGGPLAFLNKKHFHTGSIRNVEEVWKREQKAAREEARLEELQKQIAQERQLEELAQVAEKAGHARPQDRLDWMYGGGVGDRSEAQRKKEEVEEMAKPVKLENEETSKSRAEHVSVLPSFYVEDTPQSANETWARLNNDPLMMIKRQEQEAIKKIRKNPVQMERIKKEVKKMKDMRKEKKKLRSDIKELRRVKKEETYHQPNRHSLFKRKRSDEVDASHHKRREGYGLRISSFHQEDDEKLKSRAEDTRRRIKEAGERNLIEKTQKEKERYHRKVHQVGKVSSEEKAARLAQMSQDANMRHQAAKERIEQDEKRSQAELDALKVNVKKLDSGYGAAHAMSTDVARWVSKSERKLEDSITSRKYYSQRHHSEKFKQ